MLRTIFAGLSGLVMLSTPTIARDGTLPVILDGMSAAIHMPQAPALKTQLMFNDLVTPPDIEVPCTLSGNAVSSDTAAGQVQIGDDTFKIVGTCKDDDSDAYEVVARKNTSTANMVGRVTSSNEQVKFKGIVNVISNNVNKKLTFDLQK